MTDQVINEAIAAVCGWIKFWQPIVDDEEGCGHFEWHKGTYNRKVFPGYCHDLNEIHEAEKSLNVEESEEYAILLHAMTASRHSYNLNCFQALSSTARQRAEAFLRVKGLWPKEKTP